MARASLNRDYETIKTGLLALPQEAFIEEVLKERHRELLFECKIWRDCFRTQTYPKLDEATGNVSFIPLIGAQIIFRYLYPYIVYDIRYQESDLYWQVPISAWQRNPGLLEPPLE